MKMKYGDFVWFDLVTPNADAAVRFYTALVDWTVEESPMGEMGTYRMFQAGETGIGGIAPMPPTEGAPSHWLGYIACEDVDATAEKAAEMGAQLLTEGMDIPEVGRFYVISAPAGGVFAAFQPTNMDEMPEIDPATPGHFGWYELYTTDREVSVNFFTELFGWGLGDAIEMADGEVYQLFNNGERDIGGIFDISSMNEGAPPTGWNYYVRVDDLDRTAKKIATGDGTVLHEPMEVPGGDRVFAAADPFGAMISFTGS
jgi:predicted enzyme related to lactoylglutathione lyase